MSEQACHFCGKTHPMADTPFPVVFYMGHPEKKIYDEYWPCAYDASPEAYETRTRLTEKINLGSIPILIVDADLHEGV